MTQSIVQQAFELWVETLELETTDISTQSHKWHDLYSKECKLFEIMRTFTEEERVQYRKLVISHEHIESNWDDICGEWAPIEEEDF